MMLIYNCSKMLVRSISGSRVISSKYLSRESRFMNKILSQNAPKKNHKVINVSTPSLFPEKNSNNNNRRRVAVLNKLFMKYITDILSTGNIDPLLIEWGFEISKVAVTPDFQNLNVYWYLQTQNNEKIIDQHLHIAGPKLRHELSQLKLMGFVPKIRFVKDVKKNQVEELEHLFQALSLTDRGEADEVEDGGIPDVPQYNNLPSMTSNIYGLDHEMIMKKVLVAKGKRINKINRPHKQDEFSSEKNEM
ncbi:putative ribosome-binding factor A, mitochondrial [Halyomorpha halys]|uniref:putative ribosome-binding factor A, mitochondrial n=1 Tax=Halyomorpha halys TaxID=286706 RepID=UPI0006D52862|nr:uncharacterized protein LOC106681550 [Halyomorpha halys]